MARPISILWKVTVHCSTVVGSLSLASPYLPILFQVAQQDYHPALLFPDHSPEVSRSVLQGSLGGYEVPPVFVALHDKSGNFMSTLSSLWASLQSGEYSETCVSELLYSGTLEINVAPLYSGHHEKSTPEMRPLP